MSSLEEWSEDDIRELINEFRRRPILWDESSEIFKDKIKKIAAWKDLAHMFNTTVADIQRRTNNLKTTFFDEEKKMKKMKAARRKSYAPWVHYEDLKFLIGESVDVTSSESDVASVQDDRGENFIPMDLESTGLPSTRTSRTTRSTYHTESKSKDTPSEAVSRFANSLRSQRGPVQSPLKSTSGFTSSRKSLLSDIKSRGTPSRVTSVVTTTKKRILSETISDDDDQSQTSQLKTSTFSSPNSKIAYYPHLGGISSSSPPNTSGLYTHSDNFNRISSLTGNRIGSQIETPPRYSPSKNTSFVSEISTRVSPETERTTKRRKLSGSDESTYHDSSLNSTFLLSPSPNKSTKVLMRDGSGDEDRATENGSTVSQILSDDYDLFGAFVASEIRNLKLQTSKIKLKGLIQRSIVQVTEEDSRLSGK